MGDDELYLSENDFEVKYPWLWKTYKFMKSLIQNREMKQPITEFLNNDELKIVIEKVKECEPRFREMVKEGVLYKGTQQTFFSRRPYFSKSKMQSWYNIIASYNPVNANHTGEFRALEGLLNDYSVQIIEMDDYLAFGLGREPGTPNFNIRPKITTTITTPNGEEEIKGQLELMNQLFCESGKKEVDDKINIVDDISKHIGTYVSNSNPKLKNETLNPAIQNAILGYLGPGYSKGKSGGSKIKKSKRKYNKCKKTRRKYNKSKKV